MKVSRPIGIAGTGSYVPRATIGNDEVAAQFGESGSWIVQRTGVKERRRASFDETTVDMAAVAARRALESAGLDARDVALIVSTSSTPGRLEPSVACGVQRRLGADRSMSFDVRAGCAGFMYALNTALAYMSTSGGPRHALVVAAECYSRYLDPTDRGPASLFGDGAGAVTLSASPAGRGFIHIASGCDAECEEYVGITPVQGRYAGPYAVSMQGFLVRQHFNFRFPRMIADALEATKLTVPDLDLVIPHQANMVMLNEALAAVGVPPERTFATGYHFGNTGTASVPLTLDAARQAGRIADGDFVMLAALGAGIAWGIALLRWHTPTGPAA